MEIDAFFPNGAVRTMVGEVPDVTDDDGHQDRLTQIRDHAQASLDALLAQYRFIGLLAGVRGPNDEWQDVVDARESVFEALADVFSYAEENSIDAMRGELRESIAQRGVDSYNNKHLNAALYPGGLSDLHLNSAIAYLNGSTASPGAYTLGSHLEREEEILMDYLSRTQNLDQYNQYFEQHALSQRVLQAEAERRRIEAENYRPWYERLWGFITDLYERAIEEIRSGQWLVSLANFTISAALAVAEELVINALVAAVIALTGGVATFLYGILRGAVSLMLRVARTTGRAFRIQVHKLRRPANGSTFQADTSTLHRKDVDVETDLTPDEARAFGEGGQGTTRPDADPAEPGTSGQSAEAREAELGRQRNTTGTDGEDYFNRTHGGRSLQNGSGHGIDNIQDHGDRIVFNEIKTSQGSDFRLRGHELQGGESFVRQRLTSMANGTDGYGNLSGADRAYARDLLSRMRTADVEYNVVELRRLDDGTIEEVGTRAWSADAAAYRRWRVQQAAARERRAARQAAAEGVPPPSTGPPE